MSEAIERAPGPALRAVVRGFDELTARELYALLALRQRVFVVEQRCAYLDADGLDASALHVWLEGPAPERAMAAYARVFAPGVRGVEASLGRVVSDPALRRTGAGRAVVARGLVEVANRWGRVPVRISAQSYLLRFYEGFGFVREGDEYLEDDIPHYCMVRPAPARPAPVR